MSPAGRPAEGDEDLVLGPGGTGVLVRRKGPLTGDCRPDPEPGVRGLVGEVGDLAGSLAAVSEAAVSVVEVIDACARRSSNRRSPLWLNVGLQRVNGFAAG